MTIGLVSCTKRKQNYPCTAIEMYNESNLFRLASSYCKHNYDRWYVLSAKYGLLMPNEDIAPYDVTLTGASKVVKQKWSLKILEQIRTTIVVTEPIYIHAGNDYRSELVPLLKSLGYTVIVPLQSLRIGEQMSWYKNGVVNGNEEL